ncbi:MAG: acyltransferase [Thermoplasmatota archaeon]
MVDRKTRCRERPARGPRSSLWYFAADVPGGKWRVAWNWWCMALARITPWFAAKNWLYRRMGARVHPLATVGLEATFDVLFPQLITVAADTIIGYGTTILCHEYTRDWYRTGPVVIARGATVGANCTLLPGVVVGEGSVVSAMSLVNEDVPAGEVWGGVPARRLRAASERKEPFRRSGD